MKEQEKNIKITKQNGDNQLSDAEFKTVVIRVLKEVIEMVTI